MNAQHSHLKQYDLVSHCFTDQITHFHYEGIKTKQRLQNCIIFKVVLESRASGARYYTHESVIIPIFSLSVALTLHEFPSEKA